ncbi:DoxX family protein [uncultured Agrobacterium sp.]|uniref:DoxX family protein n=1 Tax=uncultured Agrobacterium sp. TaxID=157277 RepID=UPI0025F70906|nr:DoxX family protein [uncultured Agrobacterium sp.]
MAASLRTEACRRKCATGLACLYGFVGTMHLLWPKPFLKITPDWVPSPHLVILLTGLCEIAGALGIVTARLQRAARIDLALYAVCVFPANIKHAIDALSSDPSVWEWIYHLLRLPLQPVLIWLPLFAGRVVRWPQQER